MIKFIDFVREYSYLRKEISRALTMMFKGGWYVLGPEVKKFEDEFSRYCGAKYCVGVNSGTDALYLSLLSAGVGQGDEVIVPVNTAIPTAIAVLMSGAIPVLVDCDNSFLIDIEQIPKVITKKTKAIIAVHLYGQACNLRALRALAKKRHLLLIEDCAQANGAYWEEKIVGAWGDFGCFSFYPTKNIGAYGDGGAIVTNNQNYYKKLLQLRFYGQKNRTESVRFGINSRLDELQATILRVKLKYLDRWNKRRQQIAELYRKSINNLNITLPSTASNSRHVYHLFVIRSKQRDKLRKFLQKNGVETLVHYPKPLNKQAAFKRYAHGFFPRAEKYAKELLSLPLYPFLTDAEVKKISAIINRFI